MDPSTRRWYIYSWHKLLNIKLNMIYFCKFHWLSKILCEFAIHTTLFKSFNQQPAIDDAG